MPLEETPSFPEPEPEPVPEHEYEHEQPQNPKPVPVAVSVPKPVIPVSHDLPHRIPNDEPRAVSIPGVKARFAFATFLSGSEKEYPYEIDTYFIATRLLVWQLLHSKETKSQNYTVPVIVIVAERVPEHQRQRLRKDGAVVVQVPSLSASWTKAGWSGWDSVLTKLRLFEFTDFERIAFLDVDTVLSKPIDDVFDDPAVEERYNLRNIHMNIPGAIEAPDTYVFAGNAESAHGHEFPPTQEGRDWPNRRYLNAGFFIIKPDVEMLKYYLSVLEMPDSFDSKLPEQNLMNAIHRRDGNMPWQQVNTIYNIHYPNMTDVEKGVKSVHEKWWIMGKDVGKLRFWMQARRWQMEGYYEALDELEMQAEQQKKAQAESIRMESDFA
ncbi:nucleotide-diphospho-sugar transferase [Elsinoe ampelina]|uniref:Nucleotide-diphospho-sugar transferase n=1 Tax=Elsinoe ampelina TaxID=302913 RepID=A0A6A6GMH7_9PEZI|nr:nucleotide-diphospho-sugar transferase [Elsinoe ampelina]